MGRYSANDGTAALIAGNTEEAVDEAKRLRVEIENLNEKLERVLLHAAKLSDLTGLKPGDKE